jgi:hypothetical protein
MSTTTPPIGPWHCPDCGTGPAVPHKDSCIFAPSWNKTPRAKRMEAAFNGQANDPVNHPSHYTEHPSGVECIQITEHMNFCLGNAVKYIWRAGLKNDNAIEDLKKARWYVDRELERLTK